MRSWPLDGQTNLKLTTFNRRTPRMNRRTTRLSGVRIKHETPCEQHQSTPPFVKMAGV
jgi:hypothetical protein